jgi:putative transposase
MSRTARIVVPGFPHHVTQRGNRRADIFETDQDRQAYLRFLKAHCEKRKVSVWAYCLMSNHIHLVVVPEKASSLSEGLRDAHTVYAMYFNSRTHLTGHVWQGRFFSCVLDESHLWAAVRYVELNPVHAALVERAETYPWSSAAAHCGLGAPTVLSTAFPPAGAVPDWAEWLHEPIMDQEQAFTDLRRQTHTGRPCGSRVFLDQLELLLARTLRPKSPGPKPGTKYRKRRQR